MNEWILVLIVVFLVFGATKLPQLGDGLGRAITNFKRAISSQNEIEVAPKKPEKQDADKREADDKPDAKAG
jgi:sec-independent protein translocase protein TatA